MLKLVKILYASITNIDKIKKPGFPGFFNKIL